MALVAGLLTGMPEASAQVAVVRAAGTDRIATAVALSADAFPDGAPAAVVAHAGGFADALAAAPLADALGGPVLLNSRDGLDPRVRDELRRLGADSVYLMGGEAVQAAAVQARLEAEVGDVVRVAGQERFATAADAALRAVDVWRARGRSTGAHVLIALGDHAQDQQRAWPDALVAGVLAGRAARPILLVRQDGVPAATAAALDALGPARATVIGGPAAVPETVADDLRARGLAVDRIGGLTRYHTAALVADAAVEFGAAPGDLIVATGDAFPDALAAGPAAVARGGVLLLVPGADLDASDRARRWLLDHRGAVDRVLVAGGPRAVATPVLDQIDWALSGLGDLSLALQEVGTFETPLGAVTAPGDGRLFVTERAGCVVIAGSGRTCDAATPPAFLDIRDRVRTDGERGLLGFAFDPGYARNGRFFVHYSHASDGDTVLASYQRTASDPDRADPGSERVLLRIDQPASNHNGGTVTFGPDGMLYLALGDGGGGNDTFANGQNPSTPLGAILRLDVSTPGLAAAAPGNPFAAGGGDARVWAYGLRNPFRISFDGPSGLLYTADVGQSSWEEVNATPAVSGGLNFGWPVMEGMRCRTAGCDTSGLVLPVLEYPTGAAGCAIIGGHVYRGSIGELRGHYFYGDLCSGFVRSFRLLDGEVVEQRDWTAGFGALGGSILSFGQDATGEIYVSDGQRLFRVVRG